jgi:hypothetical protein
VKFKTWIHEVEIVNLRSWNREFVKLKSWSWKVELVNSWGWNRVLVNYVCWNREFLMLKLWIGEDEPAISRSWNVCTGLSYAIDRFYVLYILLSIYQSGSFDDYKFAKVVVLVRILTILLIFCFKVFHSQHTVWQNVSD